jgi:excisionase family DNA binding protein
VELWTTDECAQYLKMHPVTIRNKARHGQIPFVRVGGRLRFVPERIRDWVSAGCPRQDDQPTLFEADVRHPEP